MSSKNCGSILVLAIRILIELQTLFYVIMRSLHAFRASEGLLQAFINPVCVLTRRDRSRTREIHRPRILRKHYSGHTGTRP
jgi:hypothetical protein